MRKRTAAVSPAPSNDHATTPDPLPAGTINVDQTTSTRDGSGDPDRWRRASRAGPPCGGPSMPSVTASPILAGPFARAFAGFPSDKAPLDAHDARSAARVLGPSGAVRGAQPGCRGRTGRDGRARRGPVRHPRRRPLFLRYRRPDLMGSLDLHEVDHPDDQAWKRARVAELGIDALAGPHRGKVFWHANASGPVLPRQIHSLFW